MKIHRFCAAGPSQNRDQWPIEMAETDFMGRVPDTDDPVTDYTLSTVCLYSAATFSIPDRPDETDDRHSA